LAGRARVCGPTLSLMRRPADQGQPETWALSTVEAARFAGVSRGHVIDLCERGELPFYRVGTRRRVRAADLARHIEAATEPTEPLTRKDRVSLAIHYAVAKELLSDEASVRARALQNLETMRRANIDGAATTYLAEWARLLEGSLEPLLGALTSLEQRARDLRNVTPFAGVIPDAQRRALIRAVR
jgi:excisionase family DNA binding protein